MRDATKAEEGEFLAALDSRDEKRFREIIQNPEILWGTVTQGLSDEERAWAREQADQIF